MAEKPLSLLWSLAPGSPEREAYLKELNLLNQKHRVLSTTSVWSSVHSGELHKVTELDFEHARIGAASLEGAKAGAAASLAPRKENLDARDIELAKKFRVRWDKIIAAGTAKSASDLKAEIGAAEANLSRSAAIAAIDRGQK